MDQPGLILGPPPRERADAARNRRHLLTTAREMLAEQGADKLTMDALAERAGLGKGTVFRRFGTRAGIFQALLDDDERDFQQKVLSGPPPLGPGAPPLDRLIAYGRARTGFMTVRRVIARAALDGREPAPGGQQTPISRVHIRYLLQELRLDAADLDVLALQLTAALDAPLLLYLSGADDSPEVSERLGQGWEDLVRRVCRQSSCTRFDGGDMPLTGEYEPSAASWSRDQVQAYESSGGTAGNELNGKPVIILTSVGAKSGKLRKTPLMRVEHDGEYAVVASLGGAPKHPVWYYNLTANPHVELQDGSAKSDYVAKEVQGAEREAWWERAVAAWPDYAEYQKKTTRVLPVFVLTPVRRLTR